MILGIHESGNLECLKVPQINILIVGSLEAWENPFWSQGAQDFQVTCIGSRRQPWVSTELPRFSLCWLHGKKAMETWHARAALELRVMIEVKVVKPGTFPLGFPTGIFQWTPPSLASVQTCYLGILWVQHLLKSFTYFGPSHPGECQVLYRCAEGWIHAPNIATRRSNETDLHLLLILHWHWWAQGLLSWLHKGRRRGEVAQMDFFSIPFLTSV